METQFEKLMEIALKQMSSTFTGNQFYKVCRSLQVPETYLENGHATKFLGEKCEVVSRRLYKKKLKVYPNPEWHNQVVTNEASDVQQMITHLTGLGYRVMQQKTEWIEVK
jgi:hypothetical protein